METSTDIKAKRWLTLFKSYYVVWKRCSPNYILFFEKMFKSYYVVWKPRVYGYVSVMRYMFKSYYVVWKPVKEYFKGMSGCV